MKRLSALLLTSLLCGCANISEDGRSAIPETTSFAFIPQKTQTQRLLGAIPPPQRTIAVAVYDFTDQTGQFKPTETTQTLSRAVTQGASSILVKALQDAGNRSWFTIVERESLKNLLSERQIKRGTHRSTLELERATRQYLDPYNKNPNAFIWTKSTTQVLASLARFCKRFRIRDTRTRT